MTRTIKTAQEGFLEESLDFVEKVFTESEDAESGKLVRSLVKEIRSKRFYVPKLDFVMVDENNCVIGLPAVECLMVKELVAGALSHIKGTVDYSDYECLR